MLECPHIVPFRLDLSWLNALHDFLPFCPLPLKGLFRFRGWFRPFRRLRLLLQDIVSCGYADAQRTTCLRRFWGSSKYLRWALRPSTRRHFPVLWLDHILPQICLRFVSQLTLDRPIRQDDSRQGKAWHVTRYLSVLRRGDQAPETGWEPLHVRPRRPLAHRYLFPNPLIRQPCN